MSADLPPGVGTVGEELTRLLAALSARQGGTAEPEPDEDEVGEHPLQGDEEAEAEGRDGRLRREGRPEAEGGDGRLRREERAAQSPPDAQSSCTCGCHTGAVPMGQAQACTLCPLCQGIATLRSLNPALLDRLAQLAALAADTLRELAAEVTTARTAPDPSAPRPRPARSERVDIDVVDEPSGGAHGGGEAQG